jgi:hypothetical protein
MPYSPSLHLIHQLRDAMHTEHDELVKFKLAESADNLQAALNDFNTVPSGAFLTAVNSEWASAVRVLGNAGLSQVRRP